MDLSDRFRYIMKLNQLSASAFADEIGVQRSSISHILSGRNKPSLEFIQKVLKRYPKVDASWLINGTTQVQSADYRPQTEDQEVESHSAESKEVQEEAEDVARKATDKEALRSTSKGGIKKIVVFYEDQTFEEFNP